MKTMKKAKQPPLFTLPTTLLLRVLHFASPESPFRTLHRRTFAKFLLLVLQQYFDRHPRLHDHHLCGFHLSYDPKLWSTPSNFAQKIALRWILWVENDKVRYSYRYNKVISKLHSCVRGLEHGDFDELVDLHILAKYDNLIDSGDYYSKRNVRIVRVWGTGIRVILSV